MRSGIPRQFKFKLAVVVVFATGFTVLSFSGVQRRVLASAFGPTPSHTGAPLEETCTRCHGDFPVNSGEGSIELDGVLANYTPGQTFNITVTARQAAAVIYGFQLTAIDGTGQKVGTFTIPAASEDRIQVLQGRLGNNAEILREYVEHKSGGLSNGQFGSNSWTFQWTAPSQTVGRIDFYAASNSANSDGSPGGDYIYTTTKSTSPASASTFSISGRVFTPTGTAVRNAPVVLTAPNGSRQVATTSSFGNYTFPNLPSGVQYTIGVQSKRYRFTPKQITLNGNLTNADFIGLE